MCEATQSGDFQTSSRLQHADAANQMWLSFHHSAIQLLDHVRHLEQYPLSLQMSNTFDQCLDQLPTSGKSTSIF